MSIGGMVGLFDFAHWNMKCLRCRQHVASYIYLIMVLIFGL